MTTLEDLLNELPEPYCTQAKKNTKVRLSMDCIGVSRENALSMAFGWRTSPEGYTYWRELYDHLCI